MKVNASIPFLTFLAFFGVDICILSKHRFLIRCEKICCVRGIGVGERRGKVRSTAAMKLFSKYEFCKNALQNETLYKQWRRAFGDAPSLCTARR
jgi:hypothetical protein